MGGEVLELLNDRIEREREAREAAERAREQDMALIERRLREQGMDELAISQVLAGLKTRGGE